VTPASWGFAGVVVAQLATIVVVWIKTRAAAASSARTEQQVTPNHGSSMRDAIDRIERRLDDVSAGLGTVHRRVDRLYERWGGER